VGIFHDHIKSKAQEQARTIGQELLLLCQLRNEILKIGIDDNHQQTVSNEDLQQELQPSRLLNYIRAGIHMKPDCHSPEQDMVKPVFPEVFHRENLTLFRIAKSDKKMHFIKNCRLSVKCPERTFGISVFLNTSTTLMKSTLSILFFVLLSQSSACSQDKTKTSFGDCEDCELMMQGMPSLLAWQTTMAAPAEPGEPLIISGTIFKADGRTPAENVVLYVYHTDHQGYYSPAPGQSNGKRHGHLRGWMKTNKDGKYQFTTIRPASYPNRKDPEHIHPIILETDNRYYWIDEFLFDDDPKLTEEFRRRQEKRGGSGIIRLTKNEAGVWSGQRDIILGQNIPNY